MHVFDIFISNFSKKNLTLYDFFFQKHKELSFFFTFFYKFYSNIYTYINEEMFCANEKNLVIS